MVPRRGYADGPYGQIHFQQSGDGVPLLLLHQVPMSSGQFNAVYAPLAARGLRPIGIDMAGFGMSDPTAFTPGIGDYAQGVTPVLDALAIGQAAVLGHHTGALVATEVAVQFPDRVSCLIVNGPLPITEQERDEHFAGQHQWELKFGPRAGGTHFTDFFMLREQIAGTGMPPETISEYTVQALTARGKFWYGHHAAYNYRHEDGLRKVTQHGLILTNTGDMIYPLALRARDMRPDFAFAELPGGGVDIVDQQPEAWSDMVAGFVHANHS